MGNFTPGPWRPDISNPGWADKDGTPGYYMCIKAGCGYWPDGFNLTGFGTAADEALIIAAPDMHALLTEALDLIPRMSEDDPVAPALAEWCGKVKEVLHG